jgi:hypothetical protein
VSGEEISDSVDQDKDAAASPNNSETSASAADENESSSAVASDEPAKQDVETATIARKPRTNQHSAYGQWQEVAQERSVYQSIVQTQLSFVSLI